MEIAFRLTFRFFLSIFIAFVLLYTIMQVQNVNALPLNRDRQDFVDNQILVRFRPDISPEQTYQLLQEINAEIASEIGELDIYVLTVPKGKVETIIATLKQSKEVLLAEPNYYVYADDTVPNDPGFGSQYGLVNIHAPQGWDLSTGATWVTIAVIDTGVDLFHPELVYKTIQGYDFEVI